MYSLLAAVASIATVAAAVPPQQPLTGNHGGDKDLVSSAALGGVITKENLMKRAHELYEIAELSFDEYNHPTRVIGSKG